MTEDFALFRLRMPPETKQELGRCAKASGRSMNAEIIKRLQISLGEGIEEQVPGYGLKKKSETLQDAVVIAEELLKETGRPMRPTEKGAFIDTLYDLLAMYGDAEIVKDKIKNVISMEEYLKNETG